MTQNYLYKKYSIKISFIFWLIISLSVIFRFSHLDSKVFWHDEIYTELRISGYKDIELKNARFGKVITKNELLKFQGVSDTKGIFDTLKSLSQDTQMPLYYIFLKYWQDLWGNSIIAIRSLSALFSILTLPALYLLAKELFNSDTTAKIVTSLMAVSPMFIRYAQEARAYSLWTLSITISTYLLLKAVKNKKNKYWLLYAISIAFSSYTHLLSFFIYVGHFIYVALTQVKKVKTLSKYACATILGTSIFSPFLILNVLPRLKSIKDRTEWLEFIVPIHKLLKVQFSNIIHLFVSIDFSDFTIYQIYIIAIPLIIIILYAIFSLVRKNNISSWLILGCLSLIGIICLYQDLKLGGQRTRINQYFLSTYIAIFLALGYSISSGIKSRSNKVNNIWKGIYTLLISTAVITNINTYSNPTWWGWSSFQVDIANIINTAENPLVISQDRIGTVAPLFYLLDDNPESLMLNLKSNNLPIKADEYTMFLLNPSSEVQSNYEKLSKKKTKLVYKYSGDFVESELYKSL